MKCTNNGWYIATRPVTILQADLTRVLKFRMGVLYTMEKMGSSQNGHTTSVCYFVTENPSSTIASISQSKLRLLALWRHSFGHIPCLLRNQLRTADSNESLFILRREAHDHVTQSDKAPVRPQSHCGRICSRVHECLYRIDGANSSFSQFRCPSSLFEVNCS